MLPMIPLEFDEVVAMYQHMKKSISKDEFPTPIPMSLTLPRKTGLSSTCSKNVLILGASLWQCGQYMLKIWMMRTDPLMSPAHLSIDATAALQAVIAGGPSFVIAKFYIRTGLPGASLGVYSNENSVGTGPLLVFDGVVLAEGESLGGLKSLYR